MTWLLDPRLSDCRRIFVRHFELEVSIGFYEAERQRKQRVLLDIDVFLPLGFAIQDIYQASEVID